MPAQAPKLNVSLPVLASAISVCLALSTIVLAGSQPNEHGLQPLPVKGLAAISTRARPTACVLFSDGFEIAPDLLFFDGFELASDPPADPGPPITIVTSGGYTISVNLDNVTITDALGINKLVHSGNQNEYLNGKHIKDWGGEPSWSDARRSLILGDGTKLTLESRSHADLIAQTSIYDGDANLQIDNHCNAITHQSLNPSDTQQMDQDQYDGETATFETDATLGTATYSNVYDEDRKFNSTNIATPLGVTGGYANPHRVNDYYDDPRRPDT